MCSPCIRPVPAEASSRICNHLEQKKDRIHRGTLRSLCDKGLLREALQVLSSHHRRGLPISPKAFYVLLQGCIKKTQLAYGKAVYRLIVSCGLAADLFLGCHSIRMFAACGDLAEAIQVFRTLPKPNEYTWSAIILAHSNLGQCEQAIELYHCMHRSGLQPDGHLFVAVLKACANAAALTDGRCIDTHISDSDFKTDTFVCNALIGMYAKCGSLQDAHRVFDALPKRDVITWNTMISGYSYSGHGEIAFFLFCEMLGIGFDPDQATFVSILKACTQLTEAKLIYFYIVESGLKMDIQVGNSLIHTYTTGGSLKCACKVFDQLPKSAVATWNTMITGFVQHSSGIEALQLFQSMQLAGTKPNHVTFVCILKACAALALLDIGKQMHAHIFEEMLEIDPIVGNSLIDMYAKCGSLLDAAWVFSKSSKQLAATWNSIITGCVQHGQSHKALALFQKMQWKGIEPDTATFLTILKACSSVGDVYKGSRIYDYIVEIELEGDAMLTNSLIDLYIRCGNVNDARQVFDKNLGRGIEAWNAMIVGYVNHMYSQDALLLFEQMQQEGAKPDRVTFLSILKACSCISALSQGNQIFDFMIRSGHEADISIQSSLIHMYAKSGRLRDAAILFYSLPSRDLVTWNALIGGYAQHGEHILVNQLLKDMKSEGLQPDSATFVSILSGFGHVGLVKDGRHFFYSMQQDYAMVPMLEHYNCLVDLLGRVGHLNEGEDILKSMPSTNVLGWSSLLGHSKTYSNVEVGSRCYDNSLTLDHDDATGHVLMSSIFSRLWLEEDATRVEELRQSSRASKVPGKAFIEVQNTVHDFTVGENTHFQIDDIHEKLRKLNVQVKEGGHLPCVNFMAGATSGNRFFANEM